jgi:penicillin-binding protein 1A
VTVSVVQGPVCSDPGGGLRFWRRALRAGITFIVLPTLALAIAFTCVKVVSQSDQWDLPSGRLLDTVLTSCQFEHLSSAGVDVEHMICPTRLGAGEFPQVLKNAVIASEDERFFSHGAIDFPSTMRAAWHFSLGDRQGGSTITQQLARSILLKKEDSLERKLVEAVLAIRIFARLSRTEILNRYMNVVPHARNMYGFDDPARYYFGVGVQELTLPEAALLVGMLPEPNNRDPLKAPSAAIDSAATVLERMVAESMVTVEQAARAENELKRRIKTGKLRRGSKVYARLEYRAYRDLAVREAKANGIKLPEDYRLIVFLDPEFQRTLQGQICSITGTHQGAGFFMRPSGEALALAGSCSYTGEWNRATDIARSIGSTGKLFPLIGVHEAGLSLNERFSTWPLRRSTWPAEPNRLCRKRGAVTLDFALAQSCNRPWTEVAMRLGQRVIDIVRRFDITPPNAPSLVPIGGVQTSPMKLAQAYAALENGGMLPQIRFLSAVIGPRGNLVGLPVSKDGPRVMSSATASSVLQALRGPVKRGTARGANSAHALVYGKTGTSSRNEDALFVGLTQDFVGSIWLGHDRPAPMPGVHGGGMPAKSFSKLTDFYYVRLAQARLTESEEIAAFGSPWGKLKIFAARQPGIIAMTALGSLVVLCFVLPALFRRREPPVKAVPKEPPHEDRDLQHQQYQQAPLQSSDVAEGGQA